MYITVRILKGTKSLIFHFYLPKQSMPMTRNIKQMKNATLILLPQNLSIYFQIDKTYIYSYKEFEMNILTLSNVLEKAFANQGQKIREIILSSLKSVTIFSYTPLTDTGTDRLMKKNKRCKVVEGIEWDSYNKLIKL